MSDAEAFGSIGGWARMAAYSCFVPLWRDFHFYFAHRFLHIRCLYKFVHVLHHRNKEIEPWSGLCMHPIEHLYFCMCCTIHVPSNASFSLMVAWCTPASQSCCEPF